MNKLHTCYVDDVCGHTHILREKTLDELHGEIGPAYPILLDGRRGVLGYGNAPSAVCAEIVFVPS